MHPTVTRNSPNVTENATEGYEERPHRNGRKPVFTGVASQWRAQVIIYSYNHIKENLSILYNK
jgi:hypothetical protein